MVEESHVCNAMCSDNMLQNLVGMQAMFQPFLQHPADDSGGHAYSDQSESECEFNFNSHINNVYKNKNYSVVL